MKFLIQKIGGEIRHDFSFHLIQAIHFKKWLDKNGKYGIKYLNYDPTDIPEHSDIYPVLFQSHQKGYCPIGSVEFVTEYLQHFYGLTPKPRNVPKELFDFAGRQIFNGTQTSLDNMSGRFFIKSNDKIKGFTELMYVSVDTPINLPIGNYQFSECVGIESEWRVFVFENRMVGLQNYAGVFTTFPNVSRINAMIKRYSPNAPIAYTLDVGIGYKTFLLEIHDFFSCGLYGFANYGILPNMFYGWFREYLRNNLK